MYQSIALWSHPRSVSTAFERMFIEYGDFKVFHEPFAYEFYMQENSVSIPHKHPDSNHPLTYTEIRDMMEKSRLEQPVFHKDFPYHVIESLLADPKYLHNQTNTFLIRDPEEAVLSHANIHSDVTKEALGYKQLALLFDFVRELTGTTPVVINAADLINDPYETTAAYCHEINIPFKPEVLSWSEGERAEWSTWKGWHVDVSQSRGFQRPVGKYRLGYDDMPHLREYVEYCRPYYKHLDRFRLRTKKEAV